MVSGAAPSRRAELSAKSTGPRKGLYLPLAAEKVPISEPAAVRLRCPSAVLRDRREFAIRNKGEIGKAHRR